MAVKMSFVIVLGCVFGLCGTAVGQEPTDMLGKWTYTATGFPDDPRCGATSAGGEMQVNRKITARAYRGSIRSYQTTEKCKGTEVTESALTVRVRDNKVSIDYDEEGWTVDSLILDGTAMSGKDKNGIITEWTKQAVVEEQVVVASAAGMRELETYLGNAETEVVERLREYYSQTLEKGLKKTGLNEEQAGEIA